MGQVLKWQGNATGLIWADDLAAGDLGSITASDIADGTIADADISSAAVISDTKFAMINTAGKVSGNAITSGIIGGSAAIDSSGQLATTGGMVLKPDGWSATATQFFDDAGDIYVALKSPAVVNVDKTYVLPAADGSDGDLLKTDGSGNLSWIGPRGINLALETRSSDFTLSSSDNGKVFLVSGNTVVTLPPVASESAGYAVTIKRKDPINVVVISPTGL